MDLKEKKEKANVIRNRDRFGTMSSEELAALPGSEQVLQIPCEDHTVTVYAITPDTELKHPSPLLINFHGGGFIKVRGDRDKRYCSCLAQDLNCIIWDVDYSVAPEHPFPAAVNEAYAVCAYAFEHAEEYGFDKTRISIAGHSAGGTLTAATLINAQRKKEFTFRSALMEYFPSDFKRDPASKLTPKLAADPWRIRRAQTEAEYTTFYLSSEEDMDNPLCCPMFASDEEFAGFPECLVISAGTDTLVNEVDDFTKKLIENGVTVTAKRIPEAMHGFTVNRTDGWERAVALHVSFFRHSFE